MQTKIFKTVNRSFGYETLVSVTDTSGVYNFCIPSKKILDNKDIEAMAIEQAEKAIAIKEESEIEDSAIKLIDNLDEEKILELKNLLGDKFSDFFETTKEFV